MATPNLRPDLVDTIHSLYFGSDTTRLEAAKKLVNDLGKSDELMKTPLYQEAFTEENLLKLPKPELTPPGKPGYVYPNIEAFIRDFKIQAEKEAKERLQLKRELLENNLEQKMIMYFIEKQLKVTDGFALKDTLVNKTKFAPDFFSKKLLKNDPNDIDDFVKACETIEDYVKKTGEEITDQNQRLGIINFMMSGMTDENGQPIPMEEVASVVAIPANQQKNAPISPQEIQGRVIQLHKAKEEEDKLKAAGVGVPIFDEANNNALTGKTNQAPSAGEQSLSRPSPPSGMS